MIRKISILSTLVIYMTFAPSLSMASGYTPWAMTTQIERVGDGILIKGAFGDVNSYGEANYVYYPSTHHDYELVASMALTALTAGREMRFHVNTCVAISFHWGSAPVINQATNGQAIFIR